ncbi:type I-E CRISPR-associated protein Cse2/CasB [Arthrobacter woluwensis]|uniref:type I-E CRISPR-associated protein Cse2/CasB n=1 Tax=Arthrobacter woluwensis TaxID=156980 RepID=UPI000D133049|nr:type I-E CRISPR-associated protein Cse2/CasB [Arthrobacter woluwensis]PSS43030.1 type I-E CRISPR-associated protein Cse2/CasB [Arthrobacter woluwensis]
MSEMPPLAAYVDTGLRRIQAIYLDGHRPDAASVLARLRRGVAKEPGDDAWVWTQVMEGFPEQLSGRGDAPSAGERAAYAAMTLYAVHQQSKNQPMHRKGTSMGSAVGRLGLSKGGDGVSHAVKRRFDALMTFASFAELQHHARGLIQQLRAHDIPLDYAWFAEDLRLLQHSGTAPGVQLRWGRDFAFTRPAAGTDNTSHPEGSES